MDEVPYFSFQVSRNNPSGVGMRKKYFCGRPIMRVRSFAATLLLLFSASLITAQTSTGEVNGTVTDPNGAALPGAMVKLINQATKIETEMKANDSGYFTFINVKHAQTNPVWITVCFLSSS
jgi:Carboxypeptidase regulatory-like domain